MVLRKIILLSSCALFFSACGSSVDKENRKVDAVGESLPPQQIQTYEKPKIASNRCDVPQRMADLTGGIRQLFYQMTAQNNTSLNLFGVANISLGRKEMMVIVLVKEKDKFVFEDINSPHIDDYNALPVLNP